MKNNIAEILKYTGLPVLFASLCCLSPLVLLLFGFVGVSVAADLADLFYGTYKWLFRLAGLVTLLVAYCLYLQKKGICTFDEAKKRRNEVVNKFLIFLFAGVVGYIFFLYVVVHYAGVWAGVWN